MKYQKLLLIAAPVFLFIAIAGGFLLQYQQVREHNPQDLQRLHFKVDQCQEELQFDRTAHRWTRSTANDKKLPFPCALTKGTGIMFENNGSLSLQPQLTGKKGIFFHIDGRGNRKQGIQVQVTITRNKEIIFKEKIESHRSRLKKNKIDNNISSIFDFQKNDIIHVLCEGQGILVASDPVIYTPTENKDKKYIFVIALDTLRHDKIGKTSGPLNKKVDLTPNLDGFKKDAVVFNHTYAQSSWTLPSFTSFFTGLYDYNHQLIRYAVLDKAKPFLVENFSPSYMTASINGGTWLTGKIGNSRGFDSYELGSRTKAPYASRDLFKKAMEFIENNPVPRLFLFLHTYAIHAPYHPPAEFLQRLDQHPPYPQGLQTFARDEQYKKNVSPALQAAMVELYEAEILTFDHFFGEFIRYLKKNGLYEQSLIVFLSDHGEEFYDHGGWSHGHALYNESIRVPLFMKFPNNQFASTIIEQQAGLIDVFPTMLDYLQINTVDSQGQPYQIDGISLLPLIQNPGKHLPATTGDTPSPRILVSSIANCPFFDQVPRRIALMSGRYKMIFNFEMSEKDKNYFQTAGLPPQTGKFEVFDLEKDPQEKENLYPQCEKLAIIQAMQQQLKKIIQKIHLNIKQHKTPRFQFDKEELEILKSLGYI